MVTSPVDALGDKLLGKTRGAVRPDEAFHVRQVARLTGAGLGPVQRELKTLAQVGVLKRQAVGRQVLYSAEPNCVVLPELRGLILKTVGVAGLLRQALAELTPRIRVAFLFGSFAARAQHSASDVDLLVVGTVSFAEVVRALAEPQRRLGRDVNPSVYDPTDFANKLRRGHHFLTSLQAAPRVFLIGDEHEFARLAKERLDSSPSNQPRRNRQFAQRRPARPRRQRQRES